MAPDIKVDSVDRYFKLGNNLNQRDVIAVRRTTSGLLKLLHPDGVFDKEAVRACLTYALEVRRRIKEQLKKLGGMEFFDVHFSYIDNETLEEFFVNVPEQGGSKLIPEGLPKPGVVHLVAPASSGQLGLYRLETQMQDLAGSLQMALDSGATRVLLPMASATDIPTVPAELFSKFQISFYADPVDAVYKALGVQ